MALVDLQFRVHVGVARIGRGGVQQGSEKFHGYGLIEKTEVRSKKEEFVTMVTVTAVTNNKKR